MTWGGKLVVSCSILAGITIIPAQAASLVEALLQRGEEEQRQERQEQQSRQLLESATKPSMAQVQMQSPMEQGATLEPTHKCPTCHVGLHWSHATYCYNCASPLRPEATLVLPDLS